MLAAHALTTIHYLVGKELGGLKARRIVSAILRVFRVAAVDGAVVSNPIAKDTTSRSGFSFAIRNASSGE